MPGGAALEEVADGATIIAGGGSRKGADEGADGAGRPSGIVTSTLCGGGGGSKRPAEGDVPEDGPWSGL